MIFGTTPHQRRVARRKEEEHKLFLRNEFNKLYDHPHDYFAWMPVKLYDGRTAWLETVTRQMYMSDGDYKWKIHTQYTEKH